MPFLRWNSKAAGLFVVTLLIIAHCRRTRIRRHRNRRRGDREDHLLRRAGPVPAQLAVRSGPRVWTRGV